MANSPIGEVLSCAKKACLMVVHNGVYIYLSPKTAKPTERGNFFNDEFQFTFKVPTYVKDHVRYNNIISS